MLVFADSHSYTPHKCENDQLEFEVDTIENLFTLDEDYRPVYRQILTRQIGRRPY